MMSRITVTDNTFDIKIPLPKYGKDRDNLRLIANKTIGDLQKESGILVFPPKVEETDDKIKDSVIFNLKEGDNSFSLETGNIMGFIGRNDTELNICSRFTHRVKNEKGDEIILEKNDFFLHYMLEKVCHVNLTNLKSTSTPDKIFDFLPFLFPQYLTAALKQGLYKEYQTKEYNDSNVRGVVDVSRHIRFNIPANGKITYRTREYSYDNPITELVRHTIEYMRSNDTFRHILVREEETKDAVSKIDNATPLYNRMDRNKILAKTSRTIKSPYFYKYRDLQRICRMILLREKIKYDSSANKIYGILFDGAWLWEEYLATMLKEKGFVHPENKKGSSVVHPFSNTTIGSFYPDFYLPRDNGKPNNKIASIILDAKYKQLDWKNPPADDLQQMISYIHIMDAYEGCFVYPSRFQNKESNDWILKKFRGGEAILKTKGFYIPQQTSNYLDFTAKIKESESIFNE